MGDSEVVRRTRGDDYFGGLRQRWRLVLVCMLVGTAAATAILLFAPREYRAETSVLITFTGVASSSDPRASRVNLDTEAQLVGASDTVAAAAERLDLPRDEAALLADRVQVSAVPNSQILTIAFLDETPETARTGSLAFAEAYLDRRRAAAEAALERADEALQARIDEVEAQLEELVRERRSLRAGAQRAENRALIDAADDQLAELGAQLNAVRVTTVFPGRIVTEPGVPTAPSSPDRLVTLSAGVALGLLAGVGLATARHRADDRVHTADQLLESAGLPAASVLPEPIDVEPVAVTAATSANGRAYARLRNLVVAGLRQSARPVVLVSGVRTGGGPVAVNLAAALARAGEDVVLLCADLSNTSSAALLGIEAAPGLVEAADGRVDVGRAAAPVPGIPRLRVLAAGHDLDRATAVLRSRGVHRLVDDLLADATYVVVEAPASSDAPETETLAHVAGAVLLVAEAGRTTSREVRRASERFASVGASVLGGVLVRSHAARRRGRHTAGSVPPLARPRGAAGSDAADGGRSGGGPYAVAATPSAGRHRPEASPRTSQDGTP